MEDIGRLVENYVADVVQGTIRGHCTPMNVGDLPVSQICDVVFVISDAFARFAWCCVPGGRSPRRTSRTLHGLECLETPPFPNVRVRGAVSPVVVPVRLH